jgi:hypothetical protein
MLLIVIPLAWLTIVAVLLGACRAAADGDAFARTEHVDTPIGPRLLLQHGPVVDAAVHSRRAHPRVRRPRAAHRARRRRIAAYDSR